MATIQPCGKTIPHNAHHWQHVHEDILQYHFCEGKATPLVDSFEPSPQLLRSLLITEEIQRITRYRAELRIAWGNNGQRDNTYDATDQPTWRESEAYLEALRAELIQFS